MSIRPGMTRVRRSEASSWYILVDTVGLLLHALVHPADIQDRDGGVLLLSTLFGMYPFLAKLFADAGYQGPQFATAVAEVLPHLSVEIVKRSDQAGSSGFRSPTNALGRRAHLGVAQSLPSPRQGLRKPQPQCAYICASLHQSA